MAGDEFVDTSFGDGGQLVQSDSQHIHGDGDGFAVEVTGRDNHIFVGEDVGVIGSGVNLVFNDAMHMCNCVFYSSVNLWDAAEGVGVLYVLFLAGDEFAAF